MKKLNYHSSQETGWTPIFFAVKNDEMDIFKELLNKGARTEIEVNSHKLFCVYCVSVFVYFDL